MFPLKRRRFVEVWEGIVLMCPVAGIGYSDDKLLQTRIFSYADTQRHRLGPNYLMLPANAPKCQHHNNHYDGFMNFMHRDEEARPLSLLSRVLPVLAAFLFCAKRVKNIPCFCNHGCITSIYMTL